MVSTKAPKAGTDQTPKKDTDTRKPAARERTAAKSVKKQKGAPSGGLVVYIGPTIPGLIYHGTVYRGGREEALKQAAPALEKCPLVGGLMVTGENLPRERLNAKKPGTALFDLCRRVAAWK